MRTEAVGFFERGGGWVLAQSILMLTVVSLAVMFPGTGFSWPVIGLGVVLFALGGGVGIAGVVVLGKNRTPFPHPRPDTPLVRHGIYAYLRHPLYLSVILASLGWGFIWQSLPATLVALLLLPFFDAKARREERVLLAHFPEYAEYRRSTARFIPGVY